MRRSTHICGSLITQLDSGKTVGEALVISPDVIVENLGGVPEDSIHCAGLATSTLKKAVIDYMDLQREPWKKTYRKW